MTHASANAFRPKNRIVRQTQEDSLLLNKQSRMFNFLFGLALGVSAMLGLPHMIGLQQPTNAAGPSKTALRPTLQQTAPVITSDAEELFDGTYLRKLNISFEAQVLGLSEQSTRTMELLTEPSGPGPSAGLVGDAPFEFLIRTVAQVDHHDTRFGIPKDRIAMLDAVGCRLSIAEGTIAGQFGGREALCLLLSVNTKTQRRTACLILNSLSDPEVTASKASTLAAAGIDPNALTASTVAPTGSIVPTPSDCVAERDSCRRAAIATAIVCLGAIIGCAALGVGAIVLCFETGFGCVALEWVALLCSAATVAAMKGCLVACSAAFIVCETAYALCMSQATGQPLIPMLP